MTRPSMIKNEIMIPYVLGHVTGCPELEDTSKLNYVTCTESLRIDEVDQSPDNLEWPWGWYKILLSDGCSWVDVTMINWDVIALYDDPFIHVKNTGVKFKVI